MARHDALKMALAAALEDLGRNVVATEQTVTAMDDGTLEGRSDITWVDDCLRTCHVDVTVVMPTTKTALKKGSAQADAVAAKLMEAHKLGKYAEARQRIHPGVMEAGGRFGPLFTALLRRTFRDPLVLSGVYQDLTTAIVRANASIISKATVALAG